MTDLDRTIQRFNDAASDLLRSHHQDFDSNLHMFVHFCESDPTIGAILADVTGAHPVDVDAWFATLDRGSYELPVDEDERLALLWEFLKAIDSGRYRVLDFAVHVFYERKYDAMVAKFNDKVTRIVVRALQRKLAELNPPPKKSASIVIQTGSGSVNNIAVGDHIHQYLTATNPDVEAVLTELRQAVASTELEQAEREELLEDIDIVAREANRKHPRLDVMVALLTTVSAVPGLLDLGQRAIQLLTHLHG